MRDCHLGGREVHNSVEVLNWKDAAARRTKV